MLFWVFSLVEAKFAEFFDIMCCGEKLFLGSTLAVVCSAHHKICQFKMVLPKAVQNDIYKRDEKKQTLRVAEVPTQRSGEGSFFYSVPVSFCQYS